MTDIETARIGRDAGIKLAADNRPSDTDRAYFLIHDYLHVHRDFFIDDFWDWIEANRFELEPGRYVGQAIQRAIRRRQMEKVRGGYRRGAGEDMLGWVARPSVRSHLAPKWVFRSLIYQPSFFDGAA